MTRYIKNLLHVPYRLLTLFTPTHFRRYVTSPSYWPELKRKNIFRRILHQVCHTVRYGSCDEFYFLYGLDVKDFHKQADYVEYGEFMRRRDRLNRSGEKDSSTAMLRNKVLFDMVASRLGISHPEVLAKIRGGKVYMPGEVNSVSVETFFSAMKGDFFVKANGGENGSGVHHVEPQDNGVRTDGKILTYREFIEMLGPGEYIVQKSIGNQAEELKKLHPSSVNTIRLVTVVNPDSGEIEILPLAVRIGVGASHVDNWSSGGLIVELDADTGRLGKYGYFKPGHAGKSPKVSVHPDTGVEFEGYEIPGVSLAVSEAKRFHSYFREIHSIGWDIVITASGGVSFIEGNDNWEISVSQGVARGLSAEFKRLFR